MPEINTRFLFTLALAGERFRTAANTWILASNYLKIKDFLFWALADTNTNTNIPKSITSKVKKLASRAGGRARLRSGRTCD